MNYQYPKLNNWYKVRKINERIARLDNLQSEKTWGISPSEADFLESLDGKTDPYKIDEDLTKEEVDDLLEELSEGGLLDSGKRIERLGIGMLHCKLFAPENRKKYMKVGIVWNVVLLLFFIPVFMMGIYTFWNNISQLSNLARGSDYSLITGFFIGAIIGILSRNFSRFMSCLGCGSELHEAGIFFYRFLPMFYACKNRDDIKNPFLQVQMDAAGIEMNLLLGGFFLTLLKFGWFDSYGLIGIAMFNFYYVLFDLSFCYCFVGIKMISSLLGDNEFLKNTKTFLQSIMVRDI